MIFCNLIMSLYRKILFDPDSRKPAQEVLLSRKKVQIHPPITLNTNQVERRSYQRHLRILLDEKLNFKQRVDNAILKISKDISLKKNVDIICHVIHNIHGFFEAPMTTSMNNLKMNLFVKN